MQGFRRRVKPQSVDDRKRGGGVRIVEITVNCEREQAEIDAIGLDPVLRMGRVRGTCHNVGGRGEFRLVMQREGDDTPPVALRLLPDQIGMIRVGTEHERAAVVDDLPLAPQVVLECRVLDRADMVGGDVQEHAHVEGQAVHAIDLVRLRRDLHDQIAHAVTHGLAHHAEGIERFRRGQIGFHIRVAVYAVVDRREQRRLAAAEGAEHGVGEVGGRGLAFGAGDADHGQLLLRTTVEFRG